MGCRSPVLIPGLSQAALPEVAGLPRAVHAGPAGPLGLWTHGAPSLEDARQHRFGGECVLTFYSPLQGRAKIQNAALSPRLLGSVFYITDSGDSPPL